MNTENELLNKNLDKLIETAKTVRKNAYTPYSNFKVGAALLTKSGKIYSGCNIENGGIMSICAERVAFTKAVSEGEKEFEAILVVGGKDELIYTTPCGYCRQFMTEFCKKDFIVCMYYGDGKIVKKTLEELLPDSFILNE